MTHMTHAIKNLDEEKHQKMALKPLIVVFEFNLDEGHDYTDKRYVLSCCCFDSTGNLTPISCVNT